MLQNSRYTPLLSLLLLASVWPNPECLASEIVNPGFEQEWEGWTVSNLSKPAASISSGSHSGKKSAKLKKESVHVRQIVDVEQGKRYVLSAFIRGSGNIGVKVGDEVYYEHAETEPKEWAEAAVVFPSGGQTRVVVFGKFMDREGRFDDFSLNVVEGKKVKFSKHFTSKSR